MVFDVLIPTAIVGGVGLLAGLGLSVASKKFEVKVDERVGLVREVLPGANCGACGQTGCDAFAEAVVEGKCKPNGCPVGGQEVADKIGEILGVKAEAAVAKVARVMCSGTYEACKQKYEYSGIEDCAAASVLFGGPSGCSYGCVGMGNCVRACPFDAIVLVNGVARVVESRCKACEMCVSQVREITSGLMRIAKTLNIAIIIVGHVTKEGAIAGPGFLSTWWTLCCTLRAKDI